MSVILFVSANVGAFSGRDDQLVASSSALPQKYLSAGWWLRGLHQRKPARGLVLARAKPQANLLLTCLLPAGREERFLQVNEGLFGS